MPTPTYADYLREFLHNHERLHDQLSGKPARTNEEIDSEINLLLTAWGFDLSEWNVAVDQVLKDDVGE